MQDERGGPPQSAPSPPPSLPLPPAPPVPSLPSISLAPSLLAPSDGYFPLLEAWRAAPPTTARGPGKPPLPLRSGTQEEIKARKEAHRDALLHWSVLHHEWKEANDKRKASARAERDSKRPRQSDQQQQRSEDARRRRAVLALRAAARSRSLPLLSPSLVCRIGDLTQQE